MFYFFQTSKCESPFFDSLQVFAHHNKLSELWSCHFLSERHKLQVSCQGLDLEFVGARKESSQRNSNKPIIADVSMKDDQLRRDYKINALYWSLNKENFGELFDPYEGIQSFNE